MGLDIRHYKAILNRPEIYPDCENYVSEAEFEGFNADFQYFHPFIQNIDVPKQFKSLIFPKNESEIEDVKMWFGKHEQVEILFERTHAEISRSVDEYLKRNHIADCSVHKWDTDQWVVFALFNLEKQTGFYCEDVGYQRKGMNEKFWTRFSSDTIYNFTKREDFEFAVSCIGSLRWGVIEDEDIKQSFQEDFVNKYEVNRSWMQLSY